MPARPELLTLKAAMSKTPPGPKAPHYSRKLARQITLTDGTALRTLRDAANLHAAKVLDRQRGILEIAIERLMQAATTGMRGDIKAATAVFLRVVRAGK